MLSGVVSALSPAVSWCSCRSSYGWCVLPPGPAALLQTKLEAGERKTEAILVAQLSPAQRDTLRHMQPQAVAAWWAPGHPGWAIFPMDSDAFLQVGRDGRSMRTRVKVLSCRQAPERQRGASGLLGGP